MMMEYKIEVPTDWRAWIYYMQIIIKPMDPLAVLFVVSEQRDCNLLTILINVYTANFAFIDCDTFTH